MPNDRRRPTTPDQEQIVDAAAKLFEKRGFRNATMQDLADSLGIAKPTLYVHAKGKQQLLEAICERVLKEGDSLIDAAVALPDHDDSLKLLISSWTETAVRLSSHYNVYIGDERELPPRLAKRFREWSLEALDRLREIIIDGQEKGVFDPTLDATTVVFTIFALPNWTARWFRAARGLSVHEVSDTYYRILSNGLRAPVSAGPIAPP